MCSQVGMFKVVMERFTLGHMARPTPEFRAHALKRMGSGGQGRMGLWLT